MRFGISTTTKLLSLTLFAIFLLIGCGTLETRDVPPIEKKAVSIPVSVMDSSGNPIDNASITSHGETIDANDQPSHTVFSQNGHALFYAQSKDGNQIRITASKKGYIDTGVEVNASAAGEYPVRIVMIRIENETLEGVSTAQQIFSNGIGANGRTLKEITLAVNNAAITIPAGAVLKTQDQSPAAAGDLSVLLAGFDAAAAVAFPGNFNVVGANVPDGNGSSSDSAVSMITGGYTSIILEDAGDNRIKFGTFIVTIDVTLSINPKTGKPVEAGETLEVWSYDETTGRWSYEGEGIVTKAGEKLQVTYTAKHLSFYNLVYRDGPTCFIRINFPEAAGERTSWTFSLPEGWTNTAEDRFKDGALDLANAPANRDVTTVISHLGDQILTTVLTFSDPENDGTCAPITVDLGGLIGDTVPTTLTFTESCPSGLHLQPVPNVELYKTFPATYIGMSDANGNITVNLVENVATGLDYFLALGLNNPRYVGVQDDGNGYNFMQDSISVTGGTDQTINFTLAEEYCLPPTTGTGSGN